MTRMESGWSRSYVPLKEVSDLDDDVDNDKEEDHEDCTDDEDKTGKEEGVSRSEQESGSVSKEKLQEDAPDSVNEEELQKDVLPLQKSGLIEHELANKLQKRSMKLISSSSISYYEPDNMDSCEKVCFFKNVLLYCCSCFFCRIKERTFMKGTILNLFQ